MQFAYCVCFSQPNQTVQIAGSSFGPDMGTGFKEKLSAWGQLIVWGNADTDFFPPLSIFGRLESL